MHTMSRTKKILASAIVMIAGLYVVIFSCSTPSQIVYEDPYIYYHECDSAHNANGKTLYTLYVQGKTADQYRTTCDLHPTQASDIDGVSNDGGDTWGDHPALGSDEVTPVWTYSDFTDAPCAFTVKCTWDDDGDPEGTDDEEVEKQCTIYAINVKITPEFDFLGVGNTKELTAEVTPSVGGTFNWSTPTDSGARFLVGEQLQTTATGQTVTIKGVAPSPSPPGINGSSVSVSYTSSGDDFGRTVQDSDSEAFTVYKVTPTSADATNPNDTKINYQIVPSVVVISSATFTAPGKTETESSLTGSFYFTYNQDDILLEESKINLSGIVGDSSFSEDCTVTKTYHNTGDANALMTVFFLGVGTKVFNHGLCEIYYTISYSISYSGKTLLVGSSFAKLYLGSEGADHIDNDGWIEKHKYSWNGGGTSEGNMANEYGMGIEYTIYKKSETTLWPPTQGLCGNAKTPIYGGIIWETSDGFVAGNILSGSQVVSSIP